MERMCWISAYFHIQMDTTNPIDQRKKSFFFQYHKGVNRMQLQYRIRTVHPDEPLELEAIIQVEAV